MKQVKIAIAIILAVIVALFSMPPCHSSCSGNSVALSEAGQIARACAVNIYLSRRHPVPLRIEDALKDKSIRDILTNAAPDIKAFWIKNEILGDKDELVVICGECFGDIPQPTIWKLYRKTPGFAAAYLDGRARVISPYDFGEIDFSEYTYVRTCDLNASK